MKLTTDEIFSFLQVALTRQLNSWWSLLDESDLGLTGAAAGTALPDFPVFPDWTGLAARGGGFVLPSSKKNIVNNVLFF